MKNIKLILILLALFLLLLFSFVKFDATQEKEQQKPVVAVTTFALYDIVKHIAQDSVEIVNILPFGVDPHSFEPTPQLMAKLEKSALIIYSGAGLEPWIQNFTFKAPALDVSKHVHLRHLEKDEHELHEHHDKQCIHNTTDPHYWLDFENMQRATRVITDALVKLQPQYEKLYRENEAKYIQMLQNLDRLYKKELSNCRLHTVVTSHNALGYLSRNYHFDVASLTGLSPEAQPSAKDVARIMREVQKDGISTIFFENFVNDSVLKRIAADTHIALDVFQPLGNITKDEAKAHLSYEDIMKRNLQKLVKALDCK
jgi:zinc transport system substrate-binding protein